MEWVSNWWSRSNRFFLLLGGIMIWICLSSGCGEREVFLDSAELKLIDSLYAGERKIWRDQLADSCLQLRADHLGALVDSIKNQRLIEVREMIRAYE